MQTFLITTWYRDPQRPASSVTAATLVDAEQRFDDVRDLAATRSRDTITGNLIQRVTLVKLTDDGQTRRMGSWEAPA